MLAHPVDVYAGKLLRLRRIMLGLTQDQLGKCIGVSPQQIQKYERGQNRMVASRIYEFASVLGVPISHFFEDYPDVPTNDNPPTIDLSDKISNAKFNNKEVTDIIRAYADINDESLRKKACDYIKSLSYKRTIVKEYSALKENYN